MNKIEIRNATINDASTILRFINELATYEKSQQSVKAKIEDIEQSLSRVNNHKQKRCN
ncbi:hypothetical protein [Vibrio eleionomae]|uniref:hypothetical protein n=1 Tax=Vibrio eleionomae TaxID=2653505 RepID=UPI0013697FA0|nr:hypothetical protein [Vibrio eleionomae]